MITKEMNIGDIVQKHPEATEVMFKYGLHCIGCHVAQWESLEQGCSAHGMDAKKIEQMVKEMNEVIEKSEK
jgi:hybrid cluster-associated redox disulfide protein